MARKRRVQKSEPAHASGLNVSGKYDDWVRDVAKMQMAAWEIPRLVKEEISKGWKQLPNASASSGPKSWFLDPLNLQYGLGYKDRRYSLTYDLLKRVAAQDSLIQAIINTRSAQVASFAQPYRMTKSLGFVIRHKDAERQMTPEEVAFTRELESFVMYCGKAEKNPYSRIRRDRFETFLRKIVRDSLTYDQCTFELVYDGFNIPFEYYAVDASTVRMAADDTPQWVESSHAPRVGFVPAIPKWPGAVGLDNHRPALVSTDGEPIEYVQVINGQIQNIYSKKELAFGVRNPRTDIYIQSYGYSEIEQVLSIVTSHLFMEQYNSNFFSKGSAPKGLLNLKGDNWTPEMLDAFRRQWLAQVSGASNSWSTPVFQSEGLEWIDLTKSNRDMEFSAWTEYLVKLICGVFLLDPAEINFDLHGGVQQTPLFESSAEWKLKASRDRGLKPLLRFLAGLINENIIDRIDDHFTFEFVGLDEMSEQEKHKLAIEQVSSYKHLNEVRRANGLPDDPYGDMPLNPVYLQAVELQMQLKQQKQAEEQQAMMAAHGQLPMSQESGQGSTMSDALWLDNNLSGESNNGQ